MLAMVDALHFEYMEVGAMGSCAEKEYLMTADCLTHSRYMCLTYHPQNHYSMTPLTQHSRWRRIWVTAKANEALSWKAASKTPNNIQIQTIKSDNGRWYSLWHAHLKVNATNYIFHIHFSIIVNTFWHIINRIKKYPLS